MNIGKNTVVTLRQRVSAADGTVIDDGSSPVTYVHGGYRDIFDKIERALDGKAVGDTIAVRLEPEDAFAEYDESLVVVADYDAFQTRPAVGDMVERTLGGKTLLFRVSEVGEDAITLDGNHPLAGLTLDFQAEVLSLRPATARELIDVHGAVTASISRLRALKMAAVCLIGVPIAAFLIVGLIAEFSGSKLLAYAGAAFFLVVVAGCLWKGFRHVGDMVRGGEVLRIDVTGLFWRDFGMVTWQEIAKVRFASFGEEAWYWVTLVDGRRFKADASTLSIGTAEMSALIASHLPAAKLEGI